MRKNYLELCNVKKSFASFTLDNVSFSLPQGYIMGLIGSNGAGKTTTIKLILNMLEADQGDIFVLGLDHAKCEKQMKQNIGVVFDSNFYVDTWTVQETEKAISPFYEEWNHQIFQEMIHRFQLSPKAKVGDLSRGMQMPIYFRLGDSKGKAWSLLPFVLVMVIMILPSFMKAFSTAISAMMEHQTVLSIVCVLVSCIVLFVSYRSSMVCYKKRR